MKKRHRHYKRPQTIRICEYLDKGRCDKCQKVLPVKYFKEKNLLRNKILVEITLCDKCLSDLISEISIGEDAERKVFLPILKYMRGDKESVFESIENKELQGN